MTFELHHGDCAEVMKTWPEASVDALVTDPPAGISFMNRKWDGDRGGRGAWIAWAVTVFVECLRLLKPGAWGFVWALPRTSHWTATALEDAGFEIRDINHHLFGTGNPKTTNKATIPEQWEGWNTAIKPAAEHWILVRKPAEGTLAQNLEEWGCGALNIDACKIPREGREPSWPANVTLSEEAAEELDASVGVLKSGSFNGKRKADKYRNVYGAFKGQEEVEIVGSEGGPSRWWYVAKPSRSEREMGCLHLPMKSAGEVTGGREEGSAGLGNARAGAGRTSGARNHHPTSKSIALMTRLVTLITPPGGVVLDPFMGGGTTGMAAVQCGFDFVGIERELEYLSIANARIHAAREKE